MNELKLRQNGDNENQTKQNKTCVTLLTLSPNCVLVHITKVHTEDGGREGVLEEDEEQVEEGTMETTREEMKMG